MGSAQSQRLTGAGTAGSPKSSASPAGPPPYDRDVGSQEIQADIDHTRAEMDETIDALSDRLRPRHLVNEALSLLRGGPGCGSVSADAAETAKRLSRQAGKAMLHQARQHPIPTALMAAGAGWLAYEVIRGSGRRHAPRRPAEPRPEPQMYGGSYVDARTGLAYDQEVYGPEQPSTHPSNAGAAASTAVARDPRPTEPTPHANPTGEHDMTRYPNHENDLGACPPGHEGDEPSRTERVKSSMHDTADAARHKAEAWSDYARDTAASAAHRAKLRAADARHRLGDKMSHTRHELRHHADDARHYLAGKANRVGDHVRAGYDYSRDKAWEAVDDYPLAVAGAAFGLGLIAGLLIPRTRPEDRWVGRSADAMRRQARHAGYDLYEHGRDAAQATAAAVADEARKQGLTPSALGEHAQHLGERVVDDVEHDAAEEGLSSEALKQKADRVAERGKTAAKQESKQHTDSLHL